MLDALLELDRSLFLKLNTEWTNGFFDEIMPVWREAKTWIPLYILIVAALFHKFGWRIWSWLLAVALMMGLSDQISSNIIKPWVARPRPCNDLFIADQVRSLLGYCRDSFSFTSSHAVNHFCLATFIIVTLKPYWGRKVYWLWPWAASIAYGQVYVGVHFPLDVLCGSLIGILLAFICSSVFLKFVGMPSSIVTKKKSN